MKTLSVLLLATVSIPLFASVSVPHITIPSAHLRSTPSVERAQIRSSKGMWYLARTGHAVYCYGPVMTLTGTDGELERVATFCRGDKLLVPLKD